MEEDPIEECGADDGSEMQALVHMVHAIATVEKQSEKRGGVCIGPQALIEILNGEHSG